MWRKLHLAVGDYTHEIMPGSMAEYGKEYIRKKSTKGNMRSNIQLAEDAEEWLPAATGGTE